MSGSETEDVVAISEDENDKSKSASSNVAKKKTTTPLSSQAQSRMSILSSACKKHEFVPFTKDGHTLFVKFTIDMDERGNNGSVATYVIRLLIEGYWTLFIHGKKLQKSHQIYPLFSCDNSRASSSKNYKLDIGKVNDLFAYLNSCIFCVGHPEFYHVARDSNRGEGLTVIPLSKDVEAVEVLRNVKWNEKTYPSTLVHKNCELIKKEGRQNWFRCRPCHEIYDALNEMNAKLSQQNTLLANAPSGVENRPPTPNDVLSSSSSAPSRRQSESPSVLAAQTAVAAQLNGNVVNGSLHHPSNHPTTTTTTATTPIAFEPPDPNGPSFLLAKNEEGRYYVLLSSAGEYFCGVCAPNARFLFPQQQETVSFNEHLWMKHHVFIDSISIWCDICHKPFFDKGRFRIHVQRDHPGHA